jgi:competence protein ComEC
MAQLVRPMAPWPLGALAVLGAALAVMRWPAAWRVAGVLLALPALLWSPPRPAPGAFEVLALDVGQGSAVLVRTATHGLLYDTGPRWGPGSNAGERVVVPALQARGETPDVVVVSHRDSDHSGGSAAVAAAWPAARWWSSFDDDPARRCVAGQHWRWDGVDFEVLHPSAQDHAQARLSTNAMSCVLRVSAGERAAWLSGDLDADREVRLALAHPELRADLLVAPHHGSRSSSHPALLNVLRPSLAIVQSGHLNRFGHPAPVVLQRYQERGMRWVNTPDCGAARWRSEQPGAIDCDRVRWRRYWNAPGKGSVGGGGPALAMLNAGEHSP